MVEREGVVAARLDKGLREIWELWPVFFTVADDDARSLTSDVACETLALPADFARASM